MSADAASGAPSPVEPSRGVDLSGNEFREVNYRDCWQFHSKRQLRRHAHQSVSRRRRRIRECDSCNCEAEMQFAVSGGYPVFPIPRVDAKAADMATGNSNSVSRQIRVGAESSRTHEGSGGWKSRIVDAQMGRGGHTSTRK